MRLDLVEVTREMLNDNWPETMADRIELAMALECNMQTLSQFRNGRTRAPATDLCQRIYEHYSGQDLISA